MSVNVNTVAASASVSLECLKEIWQEAEKLLNSQHGMSPVPGQPEEARMSVLPYSRKFSNFRISDQKPNRINFHVKFRMLELPDNPYVAYLPSM